MLKGKTLLGILFILLVVAIFLLGNCLGQNSVPNYVAYIYYVLLSITGGIFFFAGYWYAIGKPAKYKNLKSGDYYCSSDFKKRVIEVRDEEISKKDIKLRLLVTDLPRVIEDAIASDSKIKGFEKRTRKITETYVKLGN